MRFPDLEREILASDHDPGAYAIYADWLLARGDLHGELIQRALTGRGAESFLAEHQTTWLGRFDSAHLDDKARSKLPHLVLEWRNGFVKRAEVSWRSHDYDDDKADTCAAQLAELLRLDVFALIDELYLGPVLAADGNLPLGRLAAAIEEVAPPTLRSLTLGDRGDWDMSSTNVRMPASAALFNLRELHLHGGWPEIGPIDLPNLQIATFETGQLSSENVNAICTARWPELRALDIWFGDPEYGGTTGVAEIMPLLARTDLPKLRSLGVMNCAFADELVVQLADTPLLAQLEQLDLSMGNLSDAGIRAMHDRRDKFRHLAKLDVHDNALTNDSFAAAKAIVDNVVFGTRHDPDRAVPRTEDTEGSRYVSVGE